MRDILIEEVADKYTLSDKLDIFGIMPQSIKPQETVLDSVLQHRMELQEQ